jgi:uncharacterized protein DUF1573
MKARHVVLICALLGAALGIGTSLFHFGHSPPLLARTTPEKPLEVSGTAQPRVAVDSRSYDFGPVARDVKVRHAFRFTNSGQAMLTLRAGATTCTKCTVAELTKPEVAPGETVDVVVEYQPNIHQPKFRQIATIHTNDPRAPRVELSVHGLVNAPYRLVPEELILSQFSTNETKTAELRIYSVLSDQVRVVGHELTEAETADHFAITSQEIPTSELEADAKGGCRVLLTIKPGLPLGAIRQTIRLEIQLGSAGAKSMVEVPIEGTVDADISIVGQGWDQSQNRLSIGSVKSSRGATRRLLLLLRGDRRHDVTIKPGTVDPDWLKVTLGEPSELRSGAVTQIPLVIEIPPGLPPTNRLGSDQGKYAEVVLETTHPQVKQLRLLLKFVIEQ